MKVDITMTRIFDFQDFNYERYAFDINFMDKDVRKALKEKLEHDFVNKTYRMDMGNYFAIWNSDYQNFERVDDIYFDSDKCDYQLVRLYLIDGKWYYKVIEERVVDEDRRFI